MTHDSTSRFSNRVENYVKFRPNYPRDVLRILERNFDFDSTFSVADIGSGTGISSKLFLENGNEVFGVEPNREMRVAGENYLSDFEKFTSIDGTAEDTGLETMSVDLVAAFQAFHWFDNSAARKEFKRILSGRGGLVFIWNERQLDSNDFLREYERLLVKFGTDYQNIRHDQITKASLEKSFDISFTEEACANSQLLDFEGLKGRTLSSSYVPEKGDEAYEKLIESLDGLFSQHEEKGRIRILYNTNVFCGTF